MAWDDVAGKAAGNNGDKYVVLQVVLTEKLLALVQAQQVLLICNQKLINKRPKDTGFTRSQQHLLALRVFLAAIKFKLPWYLNELIKCC